MPSPRVSKLSEDSVHLIPSKEHLVEDVAYAMYLLRVLYPGTSLARELRRVWSREASKRPTRSPKST